MINYLKNESVNIVTAEDPVEYTIEGVTQCQVFPEIGLTFARYLRAFLRQDPDIIMVGEIRDRETAQLAVEASLTGHLVLSTLHTNTAAGAVSRLIEMGIDPHLLGASLIGVIGQRLVRKLCDECKMSGEIRDEQVKSYFERFFGKVPDQIYYPSEEGCSTCKGMRYRGRMAIGEVLIVDEELRELISSKASETEIAKLAVKKGMRTMFQDALEKVLLGQTSIEEVFRVTTPL